MNEFEKHALGKDTKPGTAIADVELAIGRQLSERHIVDLQEVLDFVEREITDVAHGSDLSEKTVKRLLNAAGLTGYVSENMIQLIPDDAIDGDDPTA